jgi:hypothetical protein
LASFDDYVPTQVEFLKITILRPQKLLRATAR